MILEQMLPASFRGVSFYALEFTTGGGRRVVAHEFVNSDRRYIEDLGLMPRSFKISAAVSGFGQDYFDRRDALINALELPGSAQLVHPLYGYLTVVALPYTLTEDRVLGTARFDLEFGVDQGPVQAFKAAPSPAAVSAAQSSAFDRIQAAFASTFALSLKLAGNLDAAYALINGVNSILSNALGSIKSVASAATEFAGAVKSLQANIYQLLQTPDELAQAYRTIMDLGLEIGSDDASQIGFFVAMSSFGADLADIPPKSAAKIEAGNNQNATIAMVRSFALAGEATSISIATLSTADQLDELMAGIDGRWSALWPTLDVQTKASMSQVMVALRSYMETIRPNLARTMAMTVPPTPASVLAYQLYGDPDRADELMAANNWPTAMRMSGPILVATK